MKGGAGVSRGRGGRSAEDAPANPAQSHAPVEEDEELPLARVRDSALAKACHCASHPYHSHTSSLSYRPEVCESNIFTSESKAIIIDLLNLNPNPCDHLNLNLARIQTEYQILNPKLNKIGPAKSETDFFVRIRFQN